MYFARTVIFYFLSSDSVYLIQLLDSYHDGVTITVLVASSDVTVAVGEVTVADGDVTAGDTELTDAAGLVTVGLIF